MAKLLNHIKEINACKIVRYVKMKVGTVYKDFDYPSYFSILSSDNSLTANQGDQNDNFHI